ncbi:2-dehydropantoate 2-reductase [Thalassobacillus cyri]|uniref:2-dehydropantoate 2-reductase n=1 Tax=Thalassobacillus cyri TaxID=571932 RepID=A0A1H4H6F9_9BACI|nr:2-dehydropantoate 2-reductase [Thalassobacillus cyri]SEB17221.1 2-dehydropantoate 2-reductase [Thalassobacillus cyri]
MEIGIIGGGAVGLLMAHYLGKRNKVTLYVRRSEQMELVNELGVGLGGTSDTVKVEARLIEDLSHHDLTFVCVKQNHLKGLMPVLEEIGDEETLVFLQNGMGHLERIRKLSSAVMVGVTEHGALKTADYSVRHTGKGVIRLASMEKSSNVDRLMEQLNQDHFPFIAERDYYHMLAKKLVVNAVINPLTALFEVRNGQLLENPFIHDLALGLCREACQVLKLDFAAEWENTERVARATAANYSSMYKDISACRPSEIEAITGYLLAETDTLPIHSFIYQAIKAKEFERRKEGHHG